MLTYRVLAALLAYPEAELLEALDEAGAILDREALVPAAQRSAVAALIASLRRGDLIDAQERYVDLFDRRRSVSLHLYEHVHGESRDRGQAMVRLAQLYAVHGLEIAARELPDHLPLYLEFLSVLPPAAARRFLAEALPIITAIGNRLREWGSLYAAIFDALAAIAGNAAQAAVVLPDDDDDPAALDRRWEEEQVSFLAAGGPAGSACAPTYPGIAAAGQRS